jgi:hypothetical protein
MGIGYPFLTVVIDARAHLLALRRAENLTEVLFFVRNPDSVYPPDSHSPRKRDKITAITRRYLDIINAFGTLISNIFRQNGNYILV